MTDVTLPDSRNPPSPDRYPVLVVEDDGAIRGLVARILTAQGYTVSSEGSVEEALVTLKRLPAPILVVDLALPGRTGLDLVATLRAVRHDFEAILMTANANVATLTRSLDLGVFCCVHKPFKSEDILAAVAGAANRLWLRLDLRARKQELELRNAELEASLKALGEAQAQRMLGERLTSIGRLAAGVAHEINTPLAAVIANLTLISEALAGSRSLATTTDDVDEMLHDARVAAERVRVIVRDLRTFSRADEQSVGAVDLRRTIEATINMTYTEIRHRARLVKDYGETAAVEANEARVGQVVLNLLLNAAQSISEGDVAKNEIRVTTRNAGERVLLEVRDTGAGMTPAVIEHIFDPFFTTKPIGVGTGLGLSICHGIVTGYGGEIEVESVVGKGSAFRVYLPAAKSRQVAPAAAQKAPNARRARVLAVDDDPAIRRVLARLSGPEHDVTAVSGAREALELLGAGERFDVILCDLMMPDITGMTLHAEIARRFPEAVATMVFMTGGTFTPEALTFLDAVPNQRLAKPFDLMELRGILTERVKRG